MVARQHMFLLIKLFLSSWDLAYLYHTAILFLSSNRYCEAVNQIQNGTFSMWYVQKKIASPPQVCDNGLKRKKFLWPHLF